MTTLNSTNNNNVASYRLRNDGRTEVYFGYEVDGVYYNDSVKTFATEKMALSKINKYLA